MAYFLAEMRPGGDVKDNLRLNALQPRQPPPGVLKLIEAGVCISLDIEVFLVMLNGRRFSFTVKCGDYFNSGSFM
jgi:hypothetical protein